MTTDLGLPGVGKPEDEAVKKNCQTCPSYLQPNEGTRFFKKTVGAPTCAKFGHVLGRPGMKGAQLKKVGEVRARACGSHGQPRPIRPPDTVSMDVAMPIPETRVSSANATTVGACNSCTNFVRDDAVAKEWGWTAGACSAKGKLILGTRRSIEAQDCSYSNFGTPRGTTDGMGLYPEFEENFGLADPLADFFNSKKNFVDPVDFPADKAASEIEKRVGIRGWRAIVDHGGTDNVTYLPLYRLDYFTPEERAKIPRTGQDEHPELYVDHANMTYKVAVLWRELDETPALWGEAGTGKTEFLRYMAWLMCVPFERISITGSTELEDLAGKMHFSKEKGTYFEYGRLPKAWKKPNVICLDEPNVGPPDVWQFIRPLTDNSKQLVLDQAAGERIPRSDGCYLGLCMNPSWDVRNVGADLIGDADGSRLMHAFFNLPPAKLEREIIKSHVAVDNWEITDDQLDVVMKIAKEVRDLCAENVLPITWGLRPQIKVARALRWFDPISAYRMASADYLEPEAQEALLAVVRAHAGSEE